MTKYCYDTCEGSFVVNDDKLDKRLRSKNYNYNFNKVSGLLVRWGSTILDDPYWCPSGPEILDIEITTDSCPNLCPFCYKSNTNSSAKNMSFDMFKKIIDIVPKSLTQVAFGITSPEANPDFINMMKYCRTSGIVPNFTLSGMGLTDKFVCESAPLIGAVAVSAYEHNKNDCYNAVDKYIKAGVEQVNIHLLVSDKTFDFSKSVLEDIKKDARLSKLKAVVFLGLKPKGRAVGQYNPLPSNKYKELIEICRNHKMSFGFDSCGYSKFNQFLLSSNLKNTEKDIMLMLCEPCESSLFSGYISADGRWWNCSFAENESFDSDKKKVDSLDVLAAKDFLKDIWYSEQVSDFRKRVIKSRKENNGNCVLYRSIWS